MMISKCTLFWHFIIFYDNFSGYKIFISNIYLFSGYMVFISNIYYMTFFDSFFFDNSKSKVVSDKRKTVSYSSILFRKPVLPAMMQHTNYKASKKEVNLHLIQIYQLKYSCLPGSRSVHVKGSTSCRFNTL